MSVCIGSTPPGLILRASSGPEGTSTTISEPATSILRSRVGVVKNDEAGVFAGLADKGEVPCGPRERPRHTGLVESKS